MSRVKQFYAAHGLRFDAERARELNERSYLERVRAAVPAPARVLDLGCGGGEPIGRWFLESGYRVTGIDAEPSLLALARERFPEVEWRLGDMREVALGGAFEVVVAWDSFFHLDPDDQRAMFPRFAEHTALGGLLLFTSGTHHGTAISPLFGTPLYHASLASEEYRELLHQHGFVVLVHRVSDPDCGGHTVWLTRRERDPR
ncbi:class I SAM-dependent methyltransferase [Enhygromyxa salina]|uniref:class I SAM-dependent methyltransferase n=1 Tax=Enhygromyxa salina TaxID=215803 RepID=UPI001969CBC6|nr:class I SAM-dependent methyltransferase [Enhygromyxa salina]